ncbi:MAG: recombinase family protein [Sarcina sp.]
MIFGYTRFLEFLEEKDFSTTLEYKILKENFCEIVMFDISNVFKKNNENLKKIMAQIKGGDTFVISKLSNLDFDMKRAFKVIKTLVEQDVRVIILDIGIIDTSEKGLYLKHILNSFAEFEQNVTNEKRNCGKKVAREKVTFKDGRPNKFSKKRLDYAMSLLTIHGGKYSYNEVAELTKISKSTLIRAAKKMKDKKGEE